MESASLCWILDDDEGTTNTKNEEEKGNTDKRRTENESENSSSGDDFLVTSDDTCEGLNDGLSSMKTVDMDEQQSTKRSPYTLANINFKIKKGTSLLARVESLHAFASILMPS